MSKSLVETDGEKALKQRFVDWLGTPAELRGEAIDLPSFATQQGVSVASLSRLLRTDAGVKHALQGVALGGLFRVPNILRTLGDAAESGSIRAAEIYLDFVRKTLTDQQLATALHPSGGMEEMLESAVSGAKMLLEKAKGRKVEISVEGVDRRSGLAARAEMAVALEEDIPKATPVEVEPPSIEVIEEGEVMEAEERVDGRHEPLGGPKASPLEQWEERRRRQGQLSSLELPDHPGSTQAHRPDA